jgi:hypothetical protein
MSTPRAALVLVNPDGKDIFVNEEATTLTGFATSELNVTNYKRLWKDTREGKEAKAFLPFILSKKSESKSWALFFVEGVRKSGPAYNAGLLVGAVDSKIALCCVEVPDWSDKTTRAEVLSKVVGPALANAFEAAASRLPTWWQSAEAMARSWERYDSWKRGVPVAPTTTSKEAPDGALHVPLSSPMGARGSISAMSAKSVKSKTSAVADVDTEHEDASSPNKLSMSWKDAHKAFRSPKVASGRKGGKLTKGGSQSKYLQDNVVHKDGGGIRTLDLWRFQNLSPQAQTNAMACFMEKPKCVLDPNGPFCTRWGLLIFVATVITATVTPFEVCFMDEDHTYAGLHVFNLVLTAIFGTDMFLQFVTWVEYVDKQTNKLKRVSRFDKVACAYFKGWFVIDVVSIFPFDMVGIDNFNGVRMIRCLRMIKLLRVVRCSRVLWKIQQRISLPFTIQDFIKLVVLTVLMCHWMACLWHLSSTMDPGRGSGHRIRWFDKLVAKERVDANRNPREMYLYSFYWAIMTVTTVGYGDITPVAPVETIFAILMILVGGFFWAFVLGNACNIATTLQADTSAFKCHLDDVNRMIAYHHLPDQLARTLRMYMYSTRHKISMSRNRDVLSMVSPELQGRVIFAISGAWIKKVGFLQTVSMHFIVELARRVRSELFAAQESVCQPRTLFAVEKGLAWRHGKCMASGSVWGDDLLLSCADLRDETPVMCLTFLETQFIHIDTFAEVVQNRPDESKRLRQCILKMALRAGLRLLLKEIRRRKEAQAEDLLDAPVSPAMSTVASILK